MIMNNMYNPDNENSVANVFNFAMASYEKDTNLFFDPLRLQSVR